MFFCDTCNAVPAREDRKQKYWRLGRRHLGLSFTLWRHTVKHDILNMVCDCWFPCSCVYWSLVKARKIVWESQVIDSSSITQSEALWVWRCDVTTSNSIQDGGAIVVNILVFDLRMQLQHCTYQRKTLLFALIKVSTFICKREISGLSSPLKEFGAMLNTHSKVKIAECMVLLCFKGISLVSTVDTNYPVRFFLYSFKSVTIGLAEAVPYEIAIIENREDSIAL